MPAPSADAEHDSDSEVLIPIRRRRPRVVTSVSPTSSVPQLPVDALVDSLSQALEALHVSMPPEPSWLTALDRAAPATPAIHRVRMEPPSSRIVRFLRDPDDDDDDADGHRRYETMIADTPSVFRRNQAPVNAGSSADDVIDLLDSSQSDHENDDRLPPRSARRRGRANQVVSDDDEEEEEDGNDDSKGSAKSKASDIDDDNDDDGDGPENQDPWGDAPWMDSDDMEPVTPSRSRSRGLSERARQVAVEQALAEFNREVFDGSIPADLRVEWNPRLT